MPDAVVALEILAILAIAAFAWRRARPASPPFTRPVLVIAAALVAQTLVLAALFPIASALTDPSRASRDPLMLVTAAFWGIQVARVILLAFACASWAAIVKGSAGATRSLLAILVLLVVARLGGGAAFFGNLALLVVLYRAPWTRGARGLRLFGASLLAVLFLLVALGVSDTMSVSPSTGDELVVLALVKGACEIRGDLPARAAALVRWAAPWSEAARTAFNFLFLQTLGVLLRSFESGLPFGLPRLTLRRMSLQRRFAVTYTLVRLVPAAVLVAVVTLGVPLALGIHKMVRARSALREEILRAVPLADAALDSAATIAPPRDAGRGEAALVAARRQQPSAFAAAHVVLRPTLRPLSEPDTLGDSDRPPDDPFGACVSTPETPEVLRARSPFREFPGDTLGGLIEAGGALYLATARLDASDTNRDALIAEVFVPVDSAFVVRLAREIGVDIELRTTPKTRIKRTETTLSLSPGDTTVAVPEIHVRSNEPHAPEAPNLWHRPRYLGRETTALGDWLHLPIAGPGVVLTYAASAAEIVDALGSAAFMMIDSSIGLPRIALALLVLGLAEIIAVRMGRGITRGVLEDVSTLTDAAGRIGRGDLDHRVPVRGKDELASLAGSFNAMAEDLRRQQVELVEKERIEEDLAVAREIQARFLPQSSPQVPGVEMAGVSIPSREVGGDLYYFLRLSGGRVGIALGDVSGKSIPAALLMSSVLAGLRAQTQFGADVHVAIANMNRLIVDDIEPGRFVTFFFGVVDPAAGVIRYACAGHNPPLKMGADGACEWLTEAGVPLGILPEAEYRAATASLATGDVLVLYSDGISEAEGPTIRLEGGGEEPEQFGVDRLVETVRALRDRAPTEIVDGTVDAVRRFERGVAQSDDITLVVVKMASARAVV